MGGDKYEGTSESLKKKKANEKLFILAQKFWNVKGL